MSAAPDEPDQLMTIDQLALRGDLTVRTTRYYASLGLLPPPLRRGRMAYYSAAHLARLELIRALQDHGFTLSAIERYMKRLSQDATVEDLAIQRAMLTSWAPGPREELTRQQLDRRTGRALDDDQVEQLVITGAIAPTDRGYEVLPGFDVGVQMLDMDLPLDSIAAASEAITRHMDALADELTVILRTQVLAPYRRSRPADADAAKFESTMSRLRQLTLQAVVSGFQRAADQVISRSLAKE